MSSRLPAEPANDLELLRQLTLLQRDYAASVLRKRERSGRRAIGFVAAAVVVILACVVMFMLFEVEAANPGSPPKPPDSVGTAVKP
jgi:hypothetical protein